MNKKLLIQVKGWRNTTDRASLETMMTQITGAKCTIIKTISDLFRNSHDRPYTLKNGIYIDTGLKHG